MIVECRSCHARFRLDESLFQGSKGIRVRCRKCGEITAVRNPKISFSPQSEEMRSVPSPSPSQRPSPDDKSDVAPLSSPATQSRAVPPPHARSTGTSVVPTPSRGEPAVSLPETKRIVTPTETAAVPRQMEPSPTENSVGEGTSFFRGSSPPEEMRFSRQPSVDAMLSRKIASQGPIYRLIPRKPVRSRRGYLIAVFLLLLFIGGAGYLGFTPSGNELLGKISLGMESFWLGGAKVVPHHVIRDVSAYHVPVSKSEKYFVLEGKIISGSKTAGKGIRIRVALLNEKSREIAEKTIYAGKVFTDKELRQMDRGSIEEAMSRRFDEDPDNVDILPDESLPFMAVFFDIQESVDSYRVTVIDSP